MTVAISTAGPYYSSGEIKFSSLRTNFRAQERKETSSGSHTFVVDTDEIKASEFRRITLTSDIDPIVPDSTENSGISTFTNWKTSQFRGSIKYSYITQSGTDLNLDIDAQNWNNNLAKNIRKFVFIDGTCGSNSTASYAATFDATAYNLTFDVYGSILGAGGRGGGTSGAPAISGEGGGNALYVASTNGNNIKINVRSTANIYGGGGGGEKGVNGSPGSGGVCYSEYTYQYCAGSPNSSCPSGGSYNGTRRPGCCQSTMRGNCVQSVYQNSCITSSPTSGGSAGVGGNGGNGQGYNLTRSDGVAGTAGGSGGGCGATNGTAGGTGGNGGDWASSGGNTPNSGSGGGTARAVSGSNYAVEGSISATTVKGAYNP